MSDTRTVKRKAEDLEAAPEAVQDIKKRAKKDEPQEEDVDGVIEAGGSEDEDEVDPDELEALDTTNVIEGGRRTRGVRVDYTKLKVDENGDDEDDEEDEEEDEAQAADGEVDGEDHADEGNGEDVPNGEDKEVNGQEENDE